METNMQYLNEYIVLPINVNGEELLRCVPSLSNSLHSTEYISAEKVVVSQEPELLNAKTEYITFELKENSQVTTTVSFECPKCKTEFFDNQQYMDHLNSHENEFHFVCEKCNESFNERSLYQSHLLNHQEEKLFNCKICHKGFNYENNFKVHMALHRNWLICPICDLKFHRTASLKAHVALHQVEELHSCPECSSEFDTLIDLRRHLKIHTVEVTNQPKELICNYCKVTFETSTLLKRHIASHVKVKNIVLKGHGRKGRKLQPQMKEHKHKCTVCNKSFSKFSLLERHTRIHSGERPFVCEICQKAFSQKNTLQIHLTKHSGLKPYSCTLCPAKFNQKYNLSIHVRKTHSATSADEKVFKCKECDCIFKKLASLNGHVTRVHPKDDGKITIVSVIDQLKNLGKQFSGNESSPNKLNTTKENLGLEVNAGKISNQISRTEVEVSSKVYSLRQKFVGTTKVYICPYCNKETKKPSDLIRHIRTHTKEKPYRCHCGSAFSLKSTLLSHMQVHKGKIGRKCLKCSRIFFSMKLWNTHLRSHDEAEDQNANVQDCERLSEVNSNIVTQKRRILEKTQKCHLCSASFLRKVNLKRHMLLHTGERKYKCEMCSRTFIAAYSLKEHMKCHTGMRDFGCELCDKKFFNKSLLKRHILIHYKTKPYQCPYCKKRFKNSTDCDTHSASHHDANAKDDKQIEASIIYSQQNNSLGENVVPETAPIVLEVNANGEIINNFENAFQEGACEKNLNLEGTIINPSVIHVTQSSDLQTLFVDLSDIRNQEQWNNYYPNQLKIEPNDATVLNNLNNLGQSSIVFNVQTIEEASLPVVDMENGENQEDSSENLISLMSDNLQERLWLEKTQEITNESLSHNDIGDDFLANNASLYPNTEVNFNNTLEVDENNILIASEGGECMSVIDEQNNFNENLCPIIDSSEESIANLNVIQCSTCNKIFNSAATYQAHIKMKALLKKSNLDTNDSTTTEKTNLGQAHESVTSEIIPKKAAKKHFRCVYCGKEFLNRGPYIRHCEIHKKSDSNMHKCEFCGKPFKKPSDLARHLRTHTGEKPFACDQCDKKFSLKSTLEGHYKTHNPETSKEFVCEVCNSFFSSKNARKLHMLCHTGSKPEKCSYCDERFRTRAHKRSHEKKIHINRSKVTSQSKTKRITNILATAADMAINAINGKDQEVNQEDASGLTEIQLEFPDQTNPGMRITESIQIDQVLLQQLQNSNILLQNIEEIAPTSVIQMSDGIAQNEEETSMNGLELFENDVGNGKIGNERNLECEICHKHYASKDVMRKHMQLHTMYKYVCEKCSKWFSSPEALLEHEKVHSGYRPFSCFLCTNAFAEAHHLKIHLKRIHQIVDTSSPLILKIATGETLDI